MDAQYYPINFDEAGNTFSITNNGTAPAPCVITIIPKVDFLKLEIIGLSELPIVFTGLRMNEALVIDGEKCEITVDGEDAFLHYDAWEFPRLQPGINEITIKNGIQASIAIEYNTCYI